MSFARGVALVLGFVVAVAFGVWIGPHITHRGAATGEVTASSQASVGSVDSSGSVTGPSVKREPSSHRAAEKQRKSAATTATRIPVGSTPRAISVIAPALHEQLKPKLAEAEVEIADNGLYARGTPDNDEFGHVQLANGDIWRFAFRSHHRVGSPETGRSIHPQC